MPPEVALVVPEDDLRMIAFGRDEAIVADEVPPPRCCCVWRASTK